MNFFIKSATALAVAALYAGSASAAITITGTTGTGAKTYATELVNATTVFANTGSIAAGTTVAGNLDAQTTLGFGVSLSQTRYIRLDLTGSTFGAAPDVWVNEGTVTTGPVGSNVAVSLTGTNTYIFQLTSQANYTQNATVYVKMPATLTATGTAPANLKISLFEDAPSANNNLVTGLLSSQNANLWNTAAGLNWVINPSSVEATVQELFKSFNGNLTGRLGSLTLGVNSTPAAVLDPADGSQVTLPDLISSANVVVTGDFAAAGSVFITNGSSCGSADVTGVLSNSNQTATLAMTTAGLSAASLCYTVTGNTAISKQTIAGGNPIKAALDLTAVVSPPSTAADVTAATAGEITHDGTTLLFPSIRGINGVTTYIQMANYSTIPTTYEATCYGYSTAGGSAGSTTANLVTWAGVGGTIGGNNHVSPLTAAVCPASAGISAASVIVNVASPAGTVWGVLRRINMTSGVATDVPATFGWYY